MARPRGIWSDKPWRDAIRRAVNAREKNTNSKALDRMAMALVGAACEGDMAAAKEIGDRLDGRPAQALTVDTHVTHDASSLSDADLAAIIAGRGDGDAEPTGTKH